MSVHVNIGVYLSEIFSVWSMATPEELQSALDFWRKLLDEGKADEYIAKYESKRRELGCATTVVGYKHK